LPAPWQLRGYRVPLPRSRVECPWTEAGVRRERGWARLTDIGAKGPHQRRDRPADARSGADELTTRQQSVPVRFAAAAGPGPHTTRSDAFGKMNIGNPHARVRHAVLVRELVEARLSGGRAEVDAATLACSCSGRLAPTGRRDGRVAAPRPWRAWRVEPVRLGGGDDRLDVANSRSFQYRWVYVAAAVPS